MDAEHTDSVFAEQVRLWLVDLEQKRAAQVGTRLVDVKWQKHAKQRNRQYIGSVRRKHREREELSKNRVEAKNVFVRDLRKSQRTLLLQLGTALRSRNLPDVNILTPPIMQNMLLEATAAMRGELTDSTGGRRMHIINAMREAKIEIDSLQWRTIMKFFRLPTVAELSDYFGDVNLLFAEGGLLTNCQLQVAFRDGRKPITIASLADAHNAELIPGKFPPPRRTRSKSPDALSTSVSYSQSEPELHHSNSSTSTPDMSREWESFKPSPITDPRGDLPAIVGPGDPVVGGAASHSNADAAQKHRQQTAKALGRVLDLANSWEMARGHLSRNWFRTYLATKSGGRYKPFVDWLCGADDSPAPADGHAQRDRGVFRRYDEDRSGTIEMDELQNAVHE
eukprot:COSAG02_NODE_432_length_22440_cov_53.821315_3_plen_394_part_00